MDVIERVCLLAEGQPHFALRETRQSGQAAVSAEGGARE